MASGRLRTHRRDVRRAVGTWVCLWMWFSMSVSAWTTGPCSRRSSATSTTAIGNTHSHRLTHLKAAPDESSKDSGYLPLQELLMPRKACDVGQMSTSDLAYIGDVVYELFIRSRTVWPAKRTSDLQLQVVALVRAEHQSRLLALMKEEFDVTLREQQVLSRGRNSVSGSKNRRNPAAYQDATALEALVGYLYITDSRRCEELLNWINNNLDRVN